MNVLYYFAQKNMFVHLRGHSTFSMLEAIGKTTQILEKITSLGMDAVCLCEYYAMH
ncbi:hypothetical protein GW750_09360 [bacterium]|nr:hypothetical protein [bacterium]